MRASHGEGPSLVLLGNAPPRRRAWPNGMFRKAWDWAGERCAACARMVCFSHGGRGRTWEGRGLQAKGAAAAPD